jgi:S-adenosylmethionine/arginine decarboxylase-like enzyme
MTHWGHHLILNARTCCPTSIRSAQAIAQFSKDLVKKIDMVPYGEPQVVHFGTGNKAGYTLVQLIETSNITAHFVEETNDMYLDVFSCKLFQSDDVKEMVQKYFAPEQSDSLLLRRDASKRMM